MNPEVSKEEWELWASHPVTQALRRMLQLHLNQLEQDHLEAFRQQVLLSEPAQEMQIKVAKAVGACETYRYLLEMDEEDVNQPD